MNNYSYELWYEGNCVAEDDGFEDGYEATEEAYEALKSKMEEWEGDGEYAIFIAKIKHDGILLDEVDGLELVASS